MTQRGSALAAARRARSLVLVQLALIFFVAIGTAAEADTTFGGDPTQAVSSITCLDGGPPYFAGANSCMWFWSNYGHGSDIIPLPVTGGTAVVTSVTLPAMPNPGPMQAIVLTSALAASNTPSKPDFICCQGKELSPIFTVPPNQITTVPLNLPVSATAEANLSHPGETSFGDIMAISVLSGTASLPLKYTGNNSINSPGGFDGDSAYFPAPTKPYGEFVQPTDPSGFQMLARFTLGATPTAPAPGPAAGGGLKLGKGPLRVGADGKTVGLGQATDPPTANTTQTLTAPVAARAASAGSSKAKKPAAYGAGKTTVPAGKTVAIKLKLNGKARAKLRKQHKLKGTLTIVAANAQGETQTTTKTVTIKPATAKKK